MWWCVDGNHSSLVDGPHKTFVAGKESHQKNSVEGQKVGLRGQFTATRESSLSVHTTRGRHPSGAPAQSDRIQSPCYRLYNYFEITT